MRHLPAVGAGHARDRICRQLALALCIAMIRSFRHKGIQRFFETGSTAGIQAVHAPRLARQLRQLNDAHSPQDMNIPGWKLHPLKGGTLKGHWSVWVNGNWRLTFFFEGEDAVLVDYQDYH